MCHPFGGGRFVQKLDQLVAWNSTLPSHEGNLPQSHCEMFFGLGNKLSTKMVLCTSFRDQGNVGCEFLSGSHGGASRFFSRRMSILDQVFSHPRVLGGFQRLFGFRAPFCAPENWGNWNDSQFGQCLQMVWNHQLRVLIRSKKMVTKKKVRSWVGACVCQDERYIRIFPGSYCNLKIHCTKKLYDIPEDSSSLQHPCCSSSHQPQNNFFKRLNITKSSRPTNSLPSFSDLEEEKDMNTCLRFSYVLYNTKFPKQKNTLWHVLVSNKRWKRNKYWMNEHLFSYTWIMSYDGSKLASPVHFKFYRG